ncbi:integrase catalytic domain-containing protein [Trichonephila clavipes]|nr:integrase catalytic domain-containing protein [Trichonephila clavipes]
MERNLQVQQNSAILSAEEGIEWNFIPPTPSPFRWISREANIKSMKRILLRGSEISYHELRRKLTTLMAQIEAVLNSCPLSPLSSDPNDLNPLTPGHFLTNVQFHPFLNHILLRILCPIIPGGNSFNP